MTAPVRGLTVPEFQGAKGRADCLCVVTAYEYTAGRIADEAGAAAVGGHLPEQAFMGAEAMGC